MAVTTQQSDFDELVKADLRNRVDADDAAWLREPQNIEQWYDHLITLKQEVEEQLSENKAQRAEMRLKCLREGEPGRMEWHRYEADNEKWRKSAAKFKSLIERRIREARGLRGQTRTTQYVDVLMRERDAALARVEILMTAIKEHQTACESGSDDVADAADQTLWSHIGRSSQE